MKKTKLSTWECFTMVLVIIISHTLLSSPRLLLSTTKSATILNIIYVSCIVLVIVYLIYRIFKDFPNHDILDVSQYLGGNVLKNLLGAAFIVYFIVTSSILLRTFCESIKIIYFPMTNVSFVILFFVIAVTITNHLSFNASFRTSLILLPLAFITIIFLLFGNMESFAFERMIPVLGDGFFTTFVVGIGNISAFSGIAALYFIPTLLKQPEKFKQVAFSSAIISAIYILFCVATLQFMFEFFITNDEIMPIYTATRYLEFGSFFQRLESVFLLIWMMIFASYISVSSKLSMIIFQKITSLSSIAPLIYPFSLLIFAIALIPKNYAESQFYEGSIFRYLVYFFTFGFCLSILIFAFVKKRIENRHSSLQNSRNEVKT